MRIKHVAKSRKIVGVCEACGKVIGLGVAYKFIRPRYGAQRNRHEACPTWKPSEMTSSDKLATLYGVQEDITAALANWSEVSELIEALSTGATLAEEARDGYQEAADADDKGGAIAQTNQDKADAVDEWVNALNDAASEVEGMEPEDKCANCGEEEDSHTDHEFEASEACEKCGKPEGDSVHDMLAPACVKCGGDSGDVVHNGGKGGHKFQPSPDLHGFEAAAGCAHKNGDKVCGLDEDAHTDHAYESDDSEWRAEVEQVVEDARDALSMP